MSDTSWLKSSIADKLLPADPNVPPGPGIRSASSSGVAFLLVPLSFWFRESSGLAGRRKKVPE
jgi:hypothetical protein